MRKNLFYLKNVVIVVCFIHAATLVKAQNTQHVVEKIYFPSAQEWQVKSPQFFKIDSLKLNEAIQFSIQNETKYPRNPWLTQAMQFGKEPFSDPVGPMLERGGLSGIIVYKGYIIAQWGDPNKVESCNSVTKSFVSSTIGLAYERGLIHSLEDKVYTYLPPIETASFTEETKNQNPIDKKSFIFPFDTPHNRKISWDNLLRQTSDWEGTLWGKPDWADRPSDKQDEWLTRKRNEPGTSYKYNDTRVNALALAATSVWHQSLPEVFRENIMKPIGASNSWTWTGYQNSWIVLDGKLVQSVSGGGHFGGGMFINGYDMARFGLFTLRKGNWQGKQILSADWFKKATTPTNVNPEYGFMNYFLNTQQKMYPSAPASAYAHIGNGTNMIYVDEENDLVVVVRWIENNAIDNFLKKLLASLPNKK
jgi:hypothetical protein